MARKKHKKNPKTYSLMSPQEIVDLSKKAKNNRYARRKLNEYNRIIAKETNKRMLQLERQKRNIWAYDRVKQYIKTEYGNRKRRVPIESTKKLTLVEAKLQALELTHFIKSPTSTIEGQDRLEQERSKSLQEMGVRLPENKEDRDLFWTFLENYVNNNDRIKNRVQSKQLLEDIAEVLYDSNNDYHELSLAFEYLNNPNSDEGKYFKELANIREDSDYEDVMDILKGKSLKGNR